MLVGYYVFGSSYCLNEDCCGLDGHEEELLFYGEDRSRTLFDGEILQEFPLKKKTGNGWEYLRLDETKWYNPETDHQKRADRVYGRVKYRHERDFPQNADEYYPIYDHEEQAIDGIYCEHCMKEIIEPYRNNCDMCGALLEGILASELEGCHGPTLCEECLKWSNKHINDLDRVERLMKRLTKKFESLPDTYANGFGQTFTTHAEKQEIAQLVERLSKVDDYACLEKLYLDLLSEWTDIRQTSTTNDDPREEYYQMFFKAFRYRRLVTKGTDYAAFIVQEKFFLSKVSELDNFTEKSLFYTQEIWDSYNSGTLN